MPTRELLQDPNPILDKSSKLIDICSIDMPYITSVIDDMWSYIKACFNNVEYTSMAAPQIGESIQLILIKYNNELIPLLNPTVTKTSIKMMKSSEYCASIAFGTVPFTVYRHKIVNVSAYKLNGEVVNYRARDFLGIMLQHEIDHLHGILINMHPSVGMGAQHGENID